jgi:hypothetical protein
LRRNSHPDLVSNCETATSLETLFRKKHLDMAQKLNLVAYRQPAKKQNATLDRRYPVFWKRLSLQPAPTSSLQQTEHCPEI